MSASQTFVFTLLTKDLTREWVHMMNLPTHDAGNGFIGFRVLRNLAGDKTLNTELRVWAAVNKAGHRGNKHLSLGRRFDMGQLTSLRMTAARVAQIQAAWSESTCDPGR